MTEQNADYMGAVPRLPPADVVMLLGRYAAEPGFAQFLRDAQEQGFGLSHPSDHNLSESEWADVSVTRVRALIGAYKRAQEQGR
jgi:hypothetical protein